MGWNEGPSRNFFSLCFGEFQLTGKLDGLFQGPRGGNLQFQFQKKEIPPPRNKHHHHLGRGLCIDVSRVHDVHGNAATPSQNGTLRHADISHSLVFAETRGSAQ